jgi:hypothetical protein
MRICAIVLLGSHHGPESYFLGTKAGIKNVPWKASRDQIRSLLPDEGTEPFP